MKMKKMKRYQEGGATEVEVEKKSSILDDIGLKGLPLGIVGQGLISALEKGDVGNQGLLGVLMNRKRKREMGMPEDGSSVKIEIEKSKGMGDEMMGGGRMGYAKGGRIDGCAIRGKTKGTYR